jgi:hypothetical protein
MGRLPDPVGSVPQGLTSPDVVERPPRHVRRRAFLVFDPQRSKVPTLRQSRPHFGRCCRIVTQSGSEAVQKHRSEACGYYGRFENDLVPSESQRQPAVAGRQGVAVSIALESDAVAVECKSVEFDKYLCIDIHKVGCCPTCAEVNAAMELKCWKIMTSKKSSKRCFELAVGWSTVEKSPLHKTPDTSAPGLTATASF